MTKKPYLTPNEVANLLMMSPTAIRNWVDKGELKALSTPGGHRRFLPSEVEKFAQKRGLTLNDGRPDQLRILVVDDDKQLTKFFINLFEDLDEDLAVDTANDGFEAGIKIIDFKPHIVLLDFMMPYLNGVEVCERLKGSAITEQIRVIGMTGHASKENVEAIVNAGAEVCLEKPIDIELLLETIGLTQNTSR